MLGQFTCVSVSSAAWSHPGLCLATARAGGVGLLDLEWVSDSDSGRVAANLRHLLGATTPGMGLGIRLRADQLGAHAGLLESLRGRPHWLVIGRWDGAGPRGLLASLPAGGPRRIWMEVSDVRQVDAIAEGDLDGVEGWLGRGSESGGWVGAASAFALAQGLAGRSRPFLIQGGIGPHSAAACRAAGASGVVLEEQLWLMPESPLPDAWKSHLERLGGQDCPRAGGPLGAACRIAARPNLPAGSRLVEWAERADADGPGSRAAWLAEARVRLGWGPPEDRAWPVGQAVGLAGSLARRFRTTGRLVRALMGGTSGRVEASRRLAPLAPDSPLARSHGTRYPIVQGPMTRVSDRAEFADAVAGAGALPFLALALLDREATRSLLEATRDALGDRPWGAGLLGFVDPDLHRAQVEEVVAARPPFALIAGGRPDQAAGLESRGIPTYLHAPLPALLRAFLAQGARRFVFEGSECGGHVGPLSSFAQWESMVDVLLEAFPAGSPGADGVHVLFAGGVHDARSAGMVAALAAPLAERGVKVGVLMGTAYLFTEEAVTRGAILPEFQRRALECRETVELVTGPGHAIRCAPSPFVAEFQAVRESLRRQGRPADEVSSRLERLTLGRARVASKGLARGEGGRLEPVGAADRMARGMYMMGAVAAFRDAIVPMAALHEDVSAGSLRPDAGGPREPASTTPPPPPSPSRVAIVGVSCLLPAAQTPGRFWRNMLDKAEAVTEIPARRWDWRLYYDADPRATDRIYSRWGGFLDEVPFDPIRFGIPPRSLKAISPAQLLALEATRRALVDAGYDDGDFDRSNTSVILAVSSMADLEQFYITRSTIGVCQGRPDPEALERLPAWSEESFPGILGNVVAGRIANRFDLGGSNFVVDAACASSLAALDLGVRELREGRSDMVVVGGVETDQTPHAYLCFSKTRALSPTGRARAFDRRADGIVISEGLVTLVLKRLEDAERDGDRIYAVIQATAGSSDGRGQGMTAPKSDGQKRAMRRAYERSGIDPAAVGLYEAHGTGTALGDRTELETLDGWLAEAGVPAGSVAVGSAKSLLGHTKSSAGLVGVLKAALALRHRVLPPHAGVSEPLEPLADPDGRAYLLDEARPWLTDGAAPRRAGVSAFGFGGTNFHAILEEYRGDPEPSPPGAEEWPCELVVVAGRDRDRLRAALARLRGSLRAGGTRPLRDVAYTCALESATVPAGGPRAALVADDPGRLLASVDGLLDHLDGRAANPPEGVRLAPGAGGPEVPLAFLFPGQGTAAPGVCREAALYLPELRDAMEAADRVLGPASRGPLGRLVWPAASFTEEGREAQARAVERTDVAQPAIGALSCGWLDLASRLGLRPSWAAGHSFGELTALHAAGAYGREDFLRLAEGRGRAMAGAPGVGAMAAVRLPIEELEARLIGRPDLVIANHNAPLQCVVSGPAGPVEELVAAFKAEGVPASLLPVSSAFHSPEMRAAKGPWSAHLGALPARPPRFPVWTSDGQPYPDEPDAIRSMLASQLEARVDFVGQVWALHRAGARVFLELGPGSVLSGLVRQTLEGEPHAAVSLDGGGLRGTLEALSSLLGLGVGLDVPALFEGRRCRRVELDHPEAVSPAEWFVDGGRVRHRDEPAGMVGTRALLTSEDVPRADGPPTLAAAGDPGEVDALTAYREYQETMRKFLATQEQVVSKFLDRIGGPSGPSPSPAESHADATGWPARPAPSTNGHAPESVGRHAPSTNGHIDPDAAWSDRDSATRSLLALVSEQTGYPVEVLGLGQDLEGELGIDSLKRIEILGELQKRLPAAVADGLRGQMDRLTRLRSLDGLIDAIVAPPVKASPRPARVDPSGSAGPSASNGTGPGARPRPPRAAGLDLSCPRSVMTSRREPLPEPAGPPPEGPVLVTEDELGVAGPLVRALRARGLAAASITRADLDSAGSIERRVAEVVEALGPIRALVHLSALVAPRPADDLETWRREVRVQTKSLFHLLRLVAPGLADRSPSPGVVLAATRLGGLWGRGSSGGVAEAGGGIHGILRTVEAECPGVLTRAVDFDESPSPGEVAGYLLGEFLAIGDQAEVGYPSGRRTVFEAAPAPLESAAGRPVRGWEPAAGWVVLVTGGARGITAELARGLARPGVRLVVVGRSAEGLAPGLAGHAHLDAAGLRLALTRDALSRSETIKPAKVEARVRQEIRRRQRADHFDAFRRLGAEVEYHALDVRDGSAFAGLLRGLYDRHGRIDAVLHGAGIIEDRRLVDKTAGSFDLVFDTKVDSAFVLGRHLKPEGLAWVALLSSVSGRFGNAGQVDYAAANEALNRMAWAMAGRWPSTRVVSINYGPWHSDGMASGPVLEQLAERGLLPIEPEAGRRFFLDELAHGPAGDVEVVAGRGPWNSGLGPAVGPGGDPSPVAEDLALQLAGPAGGRP